MTTTKTLTKADLAQFTGSEHGVGTRLCGTCCSPTGRSMSPTPAALIGLLDEIALAQRYKAKVAAEEFQVWTLKVKDAKATLTCDDGNGNAVYAKRIPFTDFPLDEISLYFCNKTILLPSEY